VVEESSKRRASREDAEPTREKRKPATKNKLGLAKRTIKERRPVGKKSHQASFVGNPSRRLSVRGGGVNDQQYA